MLNLNFALLTPEIIMAVLSLGLLVIGLLIPPGERKGMFPLTVFALLGTLAYTFYDFFYGERAAFLQGMYMHDQFAEYFKILFLMGALLVVLSSKGYVHLFPAHRGEFYPLIMATTLGMMLMAGASDLITMYVGLELMTITFFVLVAYRTNDGKASESAIKYLVLASASSNFALWHQLDLWTDGFHSDVHGSSSLGNGYFASYCLGHDIPPCRFWFQDFLDPVPFVGTGYLRRSSHPDYG
jgi:NADH-quinone oxidoreductase subunit N